MKDFDRAIQYPPQTGPYKVFVKDKRTWTNYSRARLQISVGNPKHDGDKLFALCEWAAARFEHVTLIVSDSLQRHNISYLSGDNIEDSYANSLLQGEQWLFRNKKALDIFSHCKVTRWDDWIRHPDFEETHKRISEIYLSDIEVANLIDQKAKEFSQKHESNLNQSSRLLISTSRTYIIEEMAAFAIMLREEQVADIYPGSWFKELFQAFSKYQYEPLLSGFPNAAYLRVDFVKNKFSSGEQAIKFG